MVCYSFRGVVCGLIVEPLDGWLFSQINGGNCVSLPLNKGYGWAANVNLEYTFEKLSKIRLGQDIRERELRVRGRAVKSWQRSLR